MKMKNTKKSLGFALKAIVYSLAIGVIIWGCLSCWDVAQNTTFPGGDLSWWNLWELIF